MIIRRTFISIYHLAIFLSKRVSDVNNSLHLKGTTLTSMAKFPCLIDTVYHRYFWSLFPISTLSIIRCAVGQLSTRIRGIREPRNSAVVLFRMCQP